MTDDGKDTQKVQLERKKSDDVRSPAGGIWVHGENFLNEVVDYVNHKAVTCDKCNTITYPTLTVEEIHVVHQPTLSVKITKYVEKYVAFPNRRKQGLVCECERGEDGRTIKRCKRCKKPEYLIYLQYEHTGAVAIHPIRIRGLGTKKV